MQPFNATATTSSPSKVDEKAGLLGSVTGTTSPSWRIFVKTVGKGFDDRRKEDDENGAKKPSSSVDGALSFDVRVSPEDRIDLLHAAIEGVTGVKASQQRLIYRGRLIGKSDVVSQSKSTASSEGNENTDAGKEKGDQTVLAACEHEQKDDDYKIKDVVGLCDGQTIHLVKKRDCEKTNDPGNNNETSGIASSNSGMESELGGGGSGALLATLLGLHGLSEEAGSTAIEAESNGNDRATTVTTNSQAGSWRSSSRSTTRGNSEAATGARSLRPQRRPHYRLGTEDLEVPDPGSMESVRQGLMTLDTIFHSQHGRSNTNTNAAYASGEEGRAPTPHPLEVNRQWYRGQWLDARDTVNQWLEATVMDVLDPVDVLNDAVSLRNPATSALFARRYASLENPRQRMVPNVDNDPAISANDMEGRRRLLLEECEPGDPREIIISDSTNSDNGNNNNSSNNSSNNNNNTSATESSQSFRPRSSNAGVKVLLIHYNGWPHRWDEWIRSDSERLRPFRTRTRHPNASSMASPTPQSTLNEAPRTNIVQDGDEQEDRFAVLPELDVALSRVSGLLQELVQREQRREKSNQGIDCGDDELEDLRPSNSGDTADNANPPRAKSDLPWMARDSDTNQENSDIDPSDTHYSDQDGTSPSSQPRSDLSSEFDDEIEHYETEQFGSDDEEIPSQSPTSSDNSGPRTLYTQGELRNLATLFDRLGRTLTDVAPHVASLAASLPAEQQAIPSPAQQSTMEARVHADSFDNESSYRLGGLLSLWNRHNPDRGNSSSRFVNSTAPVDPDHLDFANGIVNTTRGEVRGPRSRTSQEDVASLLGTYLAAASLGGAVGSNENGGSGNSSLARLLQRGGSVGSGESGIDIHIHAIVTAPGVSPNGMGVATLSSGGGSTLANLVQSRNISRSYTGRSALADDSALRSGTSLSSNIVEPNHEEEYGDLFSELYSESPTPIDRNGTPAQGESTPNSNLYGRTTGDEDSNDDNYSDWSAINSIRSFGQQQQQQQQQQQSSGDSPVATPPGNRSRSSPRRQSGERRSSVFRLFRRRNHTNNQNESNDEGT